MRSKYFYLLFIALMALGWAFYCKADAPYDIIFKDNFETYATGSLNQLSNGYGYWDCADQYNCTVQDTDIHSGTKAALFGAGQGGASVFIANTQSSNFEVTIWEKFISDNPVMIDLSLRTIIGAEIGLEIDAGQNYSCPNNNLCYWDYDLHQDTPFGTWTTNQWFKLTIIGNSSAGYIYIWIDDQEGAILPYPGLPVQKFAFRTYIPTVGFYVDDIEGGPPPPPPDTITITNPISGSATDTTFQISGTYDNQNNWKAMGIEFESWGICGTETTTICPTTQEEWNSEYSLGHLCSVGGGQSILTATGTNSFLMDFNNVEEGAYNCWHCYFANATSTSNEWNSLCPGYNLYLVYVLGIGKPKPPPYIPFTNFCESHNLVCSSSLIAGIAGTFDNVFSMMDKWWQSMYTIFDIGGVKNLGTTLGQKIVDIRGYILGLNDVFGSDFPLSNLIWFMIMFNLALIVFKVISYVISWIRG